VLVCHQAKKLFRGQICYELAKLSDKRVFIKMRRPITYAELLLVLILAPVGVYTAQSIYGFVTDRISIEIRVK